MVTEETMDAAMRIGGKWLIKGASDDEIMLRALVKLNLTHALVSTLVDDVHQACETLEKKGGVSEQERKLVKTGVGY